MVLLHILTIPILLSAFNSSTAQNSLHTGKKIVVAKNGQRYLVTYVNFQQIRNKMLLVKPISAVVKPNQKECRKTCFNTPGCVSMNVKAFNTTYVCCQLLSTDHFQKKRFFIDYPGSDYYVVSVSEGYFH